MALIGYTITVVAKQDNPYNVLPETDISIRKNSDNSLVNIYADEAGLTPIPQLGAKTDSNGQFTFYADSSLGILKAVWTNGGVIAAEVLSGNSIQSLSGLTEPSDLDLRFIQRVDIKPPIQGRDSRFQLTDSKIALRVGISDATGLDDYLGNFRGLSSPDAWGDVNNIGNGSVAFGRNGAAYAYLSAAFGHDCVTYGTASFALGAGCATGDPDQPAEDATYGYCSFAAGKNTIAKGRISNAMGELCVSGSRYSSADGYASVTGKALNTHPNYSIHGDDGAEGAAARAHGYEVESYGNFAFSYGAFLRAYNGAQVIGKGTAYNQPLIASKRGVAMGYGVQTPTVFCADGGRLGFGTDSPINRYDKRFSVSDTESKNIDDVSGNAIMASVVNGAKTGGGWLELFKTTVTHPNSGTALSTVEIFHNGASLVEIAPSSTNILLKKGVEVSGAGLSVSGKRVVGGRLAAISDSLTTDQKVTEILNVLRSHGLIES